MKRKIATIGTFWLVILACLALIAASPWTRPEPDLDFSEGCLRGYLWDAAIQHIACGLAEPPATLDAGAGDVLPQGPAKDDTSIIKPPAKDPNDPEIVPPPADLDKPEKDQGRKCPKQDNVNKQGHHNCGKGPGPGEHDNGNGNRGQDKGKGKNK